MVVQSLAQGLDSLAAGDMTYRLDREFPGDYRKLRDDFNAASAKEEALGLGQVNTAVNQMDQVTQQNAAMVEESTAASRVLADEAEELARLIGRFKVAGGGVRTATRRAAPFRQRQSQRLATRGTTALAYAHRGDEDTWEEF